MSADLTEAAAFVREVVGLPWREGAEGPDAYDCWGIARKCQHALFGRALPIASRDPAEIVSVMAKILRADGVVGWQEVSRAKHGDVVTLRHVQHPQHVGVWLDLDRGRLLHSVERAGVCFEPRAVLEMMGWGRFRFFRPVSFANSLPAASPEARESAFAYEARESAFAYEARESAFAKEEEFSRGGRGGAEDEGNPPCEPL